MKLTITKKKTKLSIKLAIKKTKQETKEDEDKPKIGFHRVFRPAFCITIYQCQGQTFEHEYNIYDWGFMTEKGMTKAQYVAFTRGKSIDQIGIEDNFFFKIESENENKRMERDFENECFCQDKEFKLIQNSFAVLKRRLDISQKIKKHRTRRLQQIFNDFKYKSGFIKYKITRDEELRKKTIEDKKTLEDKKSLIDRKKYELLTSENPEERPAMQDGAWVWPDHIFQ